MHDRRQETAEWHDHVGGNTAGSRFGREIVWHKDHDSQDIILLYFADQGAEHHGQTL